MRYLQPQRTTNSRVRSPLAAAIAIACFVAITGCGEPTGPRTICCQSEPRPEQIVSGLAVLVPELHDAADVFAQGVEDKDLASKTELAVNHLADQLLSEKVQSSREAIFQARLLIASSNDTQAIDLAPVGLALDYIERRMNEILASLAQGA
jgi:hypothetical protein